MELVRCSRCLLDTTVPNIKFDKNGICNYCKNHDELIKYYHIFDNEYKTGKLQEIVTKIKEKGRHNRYDCLIGVSGGTDSIYTLYLAKQLGLRPLALHFDNGWNSEIANHNIQNATKKLGIDLYTYVVDWEEFKKIQIAFLRASVPCVEVPTDIAITGVRFKIAVQENIKYIIDGSSFITEGTVPIDWSYIDGTYLNTINRMFGQQKNLRSHPNITIYKIFYYTFIRKILIIPILNYVDYDKNEARKLLEQELGWRYYGGHHYENIYSHWAFGWYTYHKFGFDKRKISLSGPVRTGKLTREEALKIIESPPDVAPETTEYVIRKLGLTVKEYDAVMEAPNKSFRDYKTSYDVLKRFKKIVKFAVDKNLISPVAYYKYYKI